MTAGPCPKCGYVRRPQDAAAAGECPSCGVYYAKYLARQARLAADDGMSAVAAVEEAPSWLVRLRHRIGDVPERVDRTAFFGRCATLAMLVVWGAWFMLQPWSSASIGASFLHRVDLPFHEFGHVLFRPFGEWMMFLGGSLFQCAMPLGIGVYFLLRGQPFSAAACLWWAGQNFIDVAPYIGDARSLALPLIGEWSDEAIEARAYRHDWHNVLGALGWLPYDHTLARLSKLTGSLLMLLSWAWAVLLLYRQRSRLVDYVPGDRPG